MPRVTCKRGGCDVDEPRRSLPVIRDEATPASSPAEGPPSHYRRRAYTIALRDIPKRELDRGRMLYPETEYSKPTSRGECLAGENAQRPCPFVSCKHHLYLDVNESSGSIKINFPAIIESDGIEDVATALELMPATCSLDVSSAGERSLEQVGMTLNLTREAVKNIEEKAINSMCESRAMRDHLRNILDFFDKE